MIAIIAITFVLYFGFGRDSDPQKTKIATVNGEIISKLEFENTKKMMREMLQKQYAQYKLVLTDKMLKEMNLDKMARDNLIQGKLFSQGAEELGLAVTQKEVQDFIQNYPDFQNAGIFDKNRYDILLRDKNMQPQDFEKDLSQTLLDNKTKQFLMTFAPVNKQELQDRYTFANRKVKISFIHFPAKSFEKSVNIEPKALEEYFSKNRAAYRVPDQIRVAYMIVDPEAFQDKVQIEEKTIEEYYEDNLNRFEEKKQVKVRHILFKVDLKTTQVEDDKIKEKALGVLKRAQAGEDFAKLAKEFSQDPNAAKGGLVDYFSRGQTPDKFYEQEAFKLKKGEISKNPTRTQAGYYILKMEDIKEAKVKTLAEVRPVIVQKLLANAKSEYAYDKALDLMDKLPYDVELKVYAGQNNMPVKESGYFSQNENIPELAVAPKDKEALFELNKGERSELVEIQNKYYIFQISDRKPSYLPELKEVQEPVRKAFAESLAKAEAKKEAEKYLAQLNKGAAWEGFIKDNRFTHATTNFFKQGESLPELDNVPELKEAAFELSPAKKYPEKVFENETGAFLIKWEAGEAIDPAKYAEEMGRYQANLQNEKHQNLVKSWVDFLRAEARIEDQDEEEIKVGLEP
ncbi:MAG: hypothetical protein EHM45_21185, partial [Desulfobacteraceae bacterium]